MTKKLQAGLKKIGRRVKENKAVRAVSFFLAGFVVLLFLIVAAYHLAYVGKIYPGITIVGQPVGNQTVEETIKTLKKSSDRATRSAVLVLSSGEEKWKIDLAQLGLVYNATATAQKAYRLGRSGRWLEDLSFKAKAWFQGVDLGFEYSLNHNLLEAKIATIVAQVFVPAIEPSIEILKTTSPEQPSRIVVKEGKAGKELDKRKVFSHLLWQIARLEFSPFNLPIIHISPTLTPGQIENTRQRAEKLLGKKLTLVDQETRWELEENDLIQLLSFSNGFDQQKIASWSANLAKAINQPAENATFQFSEGRVTKFRPAKEGRVLDQEKTIKLIKQSLSKLGEGNSEVTAQLPVITIPPAIKTTDVNSLGIKQLLGKGVSYFRGSIASRIHNIKLASLKLNGLLIPPGEIFSFNKALGEVSRASGYKEAYIIKGGRTILGDGGGVCQVSTTLFRAALNAGLPIVERHAHAYRVSFYEQNSPVGLDATVFAPSVDLKFKNNTPAHILIQSRVDSKNKALIFELYGTNDGRKITISKPRVWDQTPPPPDLYQDDPTLPVGKIKQIDWKAWGAKVAFDYRVERNGEVLQEKTFYSHYRPWQAVFLRGTKQ